MLVLVPVLLWPATNPWMEGLPRSMSAPVPLLFGVTVAVVAAAGRRVLRPVDAPRLGAAFRTVVFFRGIEPSMTIGANDVEALVLSVDV